MSCPDGWGRKIAERLTKSLNYGAKYQIKKGEYGEKRGWGKGTTLCVFWTAFPLPYFSYRAIAVLLYPFLYFFLPCRTRTRSPSARTAT